MGIGDEIMVIGSARRLRLRDPRRVRVLDRNGRARWDAMWSGLGYIARPQEIGDFQELRDGSGCRPYIDYARTTPERWAYTTWLAEPGELAGVTPLEAARGTILVEPQIKANASPNKQWGQWQALVDLRPDLPWAQMCPPGQPALRGVQRIETSSFLTACGGLLACRSAVLPEGGLHHAAAALCRRVVVLFGGMTSPRNTGYGLHVNLAVDDPEALGWRIPHPACARAWASIAPERVLAALEKTL